MLTKLYASDDFYPFFFLVLATENLQNRFFFLIQFSISLFHDISPLKKSLSFLPSSFLFMNCFVAKLASTQEDVEKVAIIHKKISPNTAINHMLSKKI